MNRKVYLLVREAQKAENLKNERLAYENFIEAVKVYRLIEERYPEWNPGGIEAAVVKYQKKADEIGERIFQLPEGWLKISPGMTREGKRYYQGEALAGEVKPLGPLQFEVSGFTVALKREGPLLGAACNCPDFKYVGKRYNFACKHIWAVILKEGFLGK